MKHTLLNGILALIVLLGGIVVSYLCSSFPSLIESLKMRTASKPKIPSYEEQIRILTKEEQATMSGSFQKEFQLIVASGSGTQK